MEGSLDRDRGGARGSLGRGVAWGEAWGGQGRGVARGGYCGMIGNLPKGVKGVRS